jgi:protein involved in polysaccharide export with SLBB domain
MLSLHVNESQMILRKPFLFCVTLISACQSPSGIPNPNVSNSVLAAPNSSVANKSYQVKVGNQLDIFVLEDKSFNGSYSVRETGEIIIPQLGRIYVLGMNLAEVEASIKRQLETTQLKVATVIADPSASVGTADKPAFGVAVRVSGRVMTPGRIMVPQLGNTPVTAFQAVTEAGGLLPFADKKHSYILRTNNLQVTRLPVNFERIEDGRESDIPLQEGDTIIIPQKVLGF